MTGLDVEKDRIMEVACLVTDENLHIVSEEFSTILHQPDSKLNAMDEWCTNTHGNVILYIPLEFFFYFSYLDTAFMKG